MEEELSSILGRKTDMRTPEDLSRLFRDEAVRTVLIQYAGSQIHRELAKNVKRTYFVRNSLRRECSTSRLRVFTVKTFPRVARIIFFMSSRRTPKPLPPMQAMTSYLGLSLGRSARLSSPRCCMRVTLSLAVPSSSVILASMIICGLNSLGMMKSGA